VLGMLTYEQIGPRDTSSGWDEGVQKMNSPWNPDKVQDIMFNRAKEASLAQVMREWPGVRDARQFRPHQSSPLSPHSGHDLLSRRWP